VNRRAFVTGLGAVLAAPLGVGAQQARKVWRVGYLSPAVGHNPIDEVFERSLRELGYVEGQNVRVERRYLAGRTDQFAAAARELVLLNVDVIVAWSPVATEAVKGATSTIPIVSLAGASMEKGLAHPTGNVSGVTFHAAGHLAGKHVEIVKQLVPGLSSVAIIHVPSEDPPGWHEEAEAIARPLRIRLQTFPLRGPDDISQAFAAIETSRPQGLVVGPSGLLVAQRRTFIEFATRNRIPTVYGLREVVDDGGLISFSPSLVEIATRGASFVDKICKGTKPADLPIEQPTKFELVINLKTAKALGVTIPPSLLLRANQVIE